MIHSETGMAPSRLTDSDFLAIWKWIEARRLGVRVVKAKYRVGQNVCIRKENMTFTKSAEQ